MSIVEVRDLQKSFSQRKTADGSFWKRTRSYFFPSYSEINAVAPLNFEVPEGEALAFIGPNGAGKSTTIKMLTGILHPSSGSATVMGLIPWENRQKLALGIGSVFGQKSQLWLHLPPTHTFDLLASAYELDDSAYRKRRAELIALFELEEVIDIPVRKLSLGQRMRCEIAASLLHDPKIIFLDEPTIGLDPVAKASIRDLIRRANKEKGVTVFLTSHDAGDIESLCRRVIIINHGRIILDDTVKSLQREFIKKKDIDLKLEVPFDGKLNVIGVEVLKSKGYGLKLSVDTAVRPIDEAVAELLRVLPINDIGIEAPSMEEIIAEIYKNRAQKIP